MTDEYDGPGDEDEHETRNAVSDVAASQPADEVAQRHGDEDADVDEEAGARATRAAGPVAIYRRGRSSNAPAHSGEQK